MWVMYFKRNKLFFGGGGHSLLGKPTMLVGACNQKHHTSRCVRVSHHVVYSHFSNNSLQPYHV